jgi:hypothetical protein
MLSCGTVYSTVALNIERKKSWRSNCGDSCNLSSLLDNIYSVSHKFWDLSQLFSEENLHRELSWILSKTYEFGLMFHKHIPSTEVGFKGEFSQKLFRLPFK